MASLDEYGDVTAEIMAEPDPDRALAESFDAIILAFGLDAVRRMAVEKLGGYVIYKGRNFARKTLDFAKDGDVFEGCDHAQAEPDTVISTAKNLTFIDGNMTRCKRDPSWTVKGCNTYNGPAEPEPAPVDPVDAEVQEAVDRIAELSFKYPDKVSAKLKEKVDLDTTEGLLSADGAAVEIVPKTDKGWKA